MKTPQPTTVQKILEKAEKYIRQNALYYGDNQFCLDMKDWLYFIGGSTNEVIAQERNKVIEEIEKLRKNEDGRTKARKESYKRTYNNCPDCGVDISNRHVFALRCCSCAIERNKPSFHKKTYNQAIDDVLNQLKGKP